jgi:hypothetical protein
LLRPKASKRRIAEMPRDESATLILESLQLDVPFGAWLQRRLDELGRI